MLRLLRRDRLVLRLLRRDRLVLRHVRAESRGNDKRGLGGVRQRRHFWQPHNRPFFGSHPSVGSAPTSLRWANGHVSRGRTLLLSNMLGCLRRNEIHNITQFPLHLLLLDQHPQTTRSQLRQNLHRVLVRHLHRVLLVELGIHLCDVRCDQSNQILADGF